MALAGNAFLARLSVFMLVVIGILSGFFAESGQPVLAGAVLLLEALPLAVLFKAECMEIGRPQMQPQQIRWEAAVSLGVLLMPGVLLTSMFQLRFSRLLRSLIGVASGLVGAWVCGSFGGRGTFIVMSFGVWVYGFNHMVRDPGDVPRNVPFLGTSCALVFTSCSFLTYKRDQNTIALAGIVCALSTAAGAYFKDSVGGGLFWVFVVFFFVYLNLLWLRRRRHLPEGLRGCKFIRLSYLRELAARGGRIRRCQELPPEAFGDITKAQYFIMVSHRWIHRHKCDVVIEECPEGVRLRTMLQKLEAYFSTRGLGQGRTLAERWQRFCSSLADGREVLLFFDFMSLPQVGLAPDGSLSPRTDEDEALFKRCLPHMGTLYSMFPILVCDEVVGHVAPYSASGWCFSELSIGMLGKQLDRFSSGSEPVLQLDKPRSFHGDALQSFVNASDNALASKNFFDEGDREIARGIINNFLYKSRLVDAIDAKDAIALSDVLRDLKRLQLHDFLDQPVDASLNTPLHLAVAKGFTAGVEQLMQHGAKRSCVNWSGDTPVQCLLLPRLGKAARACRFHKSCATSSPSASCVEPLGTPTSHAERPKELDEDEGLYN